MSNFRIFVGLLLMSWSKELLAVYTQQELDNALAYPINFFGYEATIGEIYGKRRPTTENFNLGDDLKNHILERRPIEIDFHEPYDKNAWGRNKRDFMVPLYHDELINELDNQVKLEPRPPSVVSIIGEPGAGKSKLLIYIETLLRKGSRPKEWIIRVDMEELLSSRSGPYIVLGDIVNCVVPPLFKEFFYNVYEINPSRVNFLLDGIDQMAQSQVDHVLSMISGINKKGATVVTTSYNDYSSKLFPTNRNGLYKTVRIPEMTSGRIEHLCLFTWLNNRAQPDLIPLFTDYAKAVSQALEILRLPRTVRVISILAHELFQEHSSIFERMSTQPDPLTLQNYLREYGTTKHSQSTDLIRRTNNMRLNMMDLYNEFSWKVILQLPGHPYDNSDHEVYGPHAYNQILGDTSDEMHTQRLRSANDKIRQSLKAYQYMTFDNDRRPIGFIRPDYQAFHAAQYVLRYFGTDSSVIRNVDGLRTILEDPKHVQVVEFINSGCRIMFDEDPLIDYLREVSISSDGLINRAMIDHLIRNGFDNLCGVVFDEIKKLGRLEELKSYIHDITPLETRTKYILGFRSELPTAGSSNQPHDPPIITGTRRELMLQMNMIGSTLALRKVLPYFGDKEDLERLGMIAIEQDSYRLFHEVFKNVPINFRTSEFYEKLLLHTIETTGLVNILIIQDLRYGVRPQDILINGRTLTHAAMKWPNFHVLKYVIENLQAPLSDQPDHDGITPTMEFLKTNPYPHVTQEGFFAKLFYWVQVRVPLPLVLPSAAKLESFKPILNDIPPEHRRLLINDHISSTHPMTYDQFRIVPPLSLPQVIQDMRMYSVFKRCLKRSSGISMSLNANDQKITLAEVAAYYRGVTSLPKHEQMNFYGAMRILCARELPLGGPHSARLIFETLLSTTTTQSECNAVRLILLNSIFPAIDRNYIEFEQLLETRLNNWIAPNYYTLDEMVLRSRADLHPGLIRDVVPIPNQIIENDEDSSSGYESCTADRRRRFLGIRCYFSRKDVLKFAEGHQFDDPRRLIINVDEFLHHILDLELHQESERARQLIKFAKGILKNPSTESAIVGKHQNLFREILKHGSFQEYDENRRFEEGMIEFEKTTIKENSLVRRFSLPPSQKKIFASSLLAIPLVKSVFDTILTCANRPLDNECAYGFGMLSLNSGLMISSHFVHKYVHTRINMKMSKLISVIPIELQAAKAELSAFYRQQLIVAARWVDAAFLAIGVILDIPNLYRSIQILVDCAKPEIFCTSQQTGAAGITLGGFVVSVGAQGGMIFFKTETLRAGVIGLVIMVGIMVALSFNDLFYYHNTYHTTPYEEFRTFWPSLIRMRPPQDVRNLINRADQINALNDYMNQYLILTYLDSDENVIAYAMGVGKIENDKFVATEAYINMAAASDSHTQGLSRVQPVERDNVTHLCLLKKVPNADYEVENEIHPDAVYECENALVIADKKRWEMRNEKSFIIYNLEPINRGVVIGSDLVNNMFRLTDSTAHLKVTGGPNGLINQYIVTFEFRGTIVFGYTSRQEILDLSHISQTTPLYFYWHHELMGMVYYDTDRYNRFNMVLKNRKTLNLHVIGRSDKPDFFQCRDPNTLFTRQRYAITVDGGGGTEEEWDTITGCPSVRLRPFTRILGMGDDTIDIVDIKLMMNKPGAIRRVYSTINPNESIMGLRFRNRPILVNTLSLLYEPTRKALIWEFYYDDSTIMVLDIMPYHQTASSGSNQDQHDGVNDIETVSSLFFDEYYNVTILPIIESTEYSVPIRQFNIYGIVPSSEIDRVHSKYQHLKFHMSANTSIYLTANTTEEIFIFGSIQSDKILFTKHTVFARGGEGPDVYMIGPGISEYVWIDNVADRGDVDFLLMSCESVHAEKTMIKLSELDNSVHDVKLTCSSRSSRDTYVILQNYLQHDDSRHLIINFNYLYYVILPQHWVQETDADQKIRLGLFVGYDQMNSDSALVLNASDTYVILNVTNKYRGWIAYRSGQDVTLGLQIEDGVTKATMILLETFFTSEHGHNISTDWLQSVIFIVDENISDNITPKILDTQNIKNLIISTSEITDRSPDYIYKRYTINASCNTNTTIDHNNNDTVPKSDQKFGAIIVENRQPGDFNASWTDDNDVSLCTNKMCINIKNWCSSVEHRINRIEFRGSFSQPIFSVRYIDQLGCGSQSRDDKEKVIDQLNIKLRRAQRRLELSHDNSDSSRLLRCVSYLYADNITQSVNYKLFGFVDHVDKFKFMQSNCLQLFTFNNLNGYSQTATRQMLKHELRIYKLSDEYRSEDQPVIDFLRDNSNRVSRTDWQIFLHYLYSKYTYYIHSIVQENKD